ncbi:aspartate aminotransferase family protein [Candidatus Marinamargulisbacteria bacterium SCGC AAA071-K20]|nr:aspartate aminotransferase family protein [Candidatus Marinamargulisbacteria bacterium SCGC AAA071-K20]
MDTQSNIKNNTDYTLFSWSKQSGLNPIHVTKADGIYFTDTDDKTYIDFSSQLMNVNIGHKHPEVNNAIKKQLESVAYVFPGMTTDVRGQLGKKLAEISPGTLKKSFFTNGGADAIENAIKMARMFTGREKIVTKYRSYHGSSYAAISAGGDPRKHAVSRDLSPGIVHVEDPYCYRCPWGKKQESCDYECASHVERIINFEGPENVAAILMEGESGSSGCIKYPPDYWTKLREIADKYGILLISDEVMSGFGRCGKWFAVENHGVIPDMIVMAKGLSSGYIPIGAVLVSEKIASFFDDTPLMLGLTYSAHALACASALATIKVYEDENLLNQSEVLGHYINDRIEELKNIHPSIGDYRYTGLLGCIELVKNKETKEPMVPWNATPEEMTIMNKVTSKLRELGLFTFVRWNWIFIAPPLTITKSQIDVALSIISKAISEVDIYVERKDSVQLEAPYAL